MGVPVAERQFGPYRLVRQIAVGGMAEIHLAKTKGIAGFEKYVALKMIHPNFAEDEQFIQMLVDEAKIAVQLNHGNIAQTFDLGRVGETFYITMEYVDGADLYKILRKGSESDIEMPLDVCAFVAKEVASALDHAHRKKDHAGKSLGIVHRDVSPQNVLISYAGEVKLVDFGIAKATMKARQTAVGVIKGKYYYMSPEQAWGDPIDFRSDIFSAGIVLYEMLTGQMLYLEEDLHRLLDMARRADIAPPTTLRRGIPPQLERIVMHALAKVPGERYQSAGDFATDLERFLHAYSPVFTAAKLSTLMKQIVGDPVGVPVDEPEIEVREGTMSTHSLNTEDLIHSSDELDRENSVIFRVADLKPKDAAPAAPAPKPAGPRITRQADIKDLAPPTRIPSIPRPGQSPSVSGPKPQPSAPRQPTPAAAQPIARAQSRPRLADEETREVAPAPGGNTADSGLLELDPPTPASHEANNWTDQTNPEGDLENIGEHTMVTGAPNAMAKGFMMDVASEDGVDATMVSSGPPQAPEEDDDEMDDGETLTGHRPSSDEDGPTMTRDFTAKPRVTQRRGAPAPPAFAAKIHAPAVSELRKPRASRKTPGAGTPQPNILQALVGAQTNEPMPTPLSRAAVPDSTARGNQNMPPSGPFGAPQPPQLPQLPQQPQPPYNGYAADASGMPLGVSTPPQGVPYNQQPYPQPYSPQQQPPYNPQYPQYAAQSYPQQTVTPGALYQLQPYGAPPPKPMSLTGQIRLFEADEMPSQYKVGSDAAKWIKLVIAGVIAISVAAGVTFFIIRSSRDGTPNVGAVHIESVPPGAEVFFDGIHLAGVTPLTIDNTPVGTRHEIRLELSRHKPYTEMVDIPKQGGEVPVSAVMNPITGKLRINTVPPGADVMVDGQLRGRTPTTINDIDMASAKHLELRLKEYSPYIQTLTWPPNGEIDIDQKLTR
jgi:serine/threonine protein kinase